MRNMATYFGEIVGISSRAVDDDEIGQESPYKLEFLATDDSKGKKYQFGIFAFGKAAVDFVHSCFFSENSHIIATANVVYPPYDNSLYGHNCLKGSREVARVFTSPENVNTIICEVDETLPDHLSPSLCENIMRLCEKSSEAMILVNQPFGMYYEDDNLDIGNEAFLRCLVSSEQMKKNPNVGCLHVKIPNIVTNFPASLLAYYEAFRKAAVLYVCYSENSASDSDVISIFNNLFSLPIWKNIKRVPDAEQRLSASIKNRSVSSVYT